MSAACPATKNVTQHKADQQSVCTRDPGIYLKLMSNLVLQVEVVVDQLHLQAGIVCYEGVVPGHAVVQVCDTLLQILHLLLH